MKVGFDHVERRARESEAWKSARDEDERAMAVACATIDAYGDLSPEEWEKFNEARAIRRDHCAYQAALAGLRLGRTEIEALLREKDQEIDRLRGALGNAKAQFVHYAAEHRKKSTAEGDAKAATNEYYEALCEAALSPKAAAADAKPLVPWCRSCGFDCRYPGLHETEAVER